MRTWRFSYLCVSLILLMGAVFVVRGLNRPDLREHPLVGLWVAEPRPGGLVMPHSLFLSPDGTGRESSGVGNFDCRWRPVGATGDVVRLRITHTGESYWAAEPRLIDVTLVSPDAIRVDGRTYARRE